MLSLSHIFQNPLNAGHMQEEQVTERWVKQLIEEGRTANREHSKYLTRTVCKLIYKGANS
jgi:hypothetical protein